MRVPQVNERVKDAPATGLRAMFSAIGQFLSVTDKLRGKSATAGKETVDPETMVPDSAAPEAAAPETAAPETTIAPETAAPETVAPETVAPETATPKTMVPDTVAAEAVAPAAAAKPKAAAKPRSAAKPKAAAKPATAAPEEAGGHVRLLTPDEAPAAPPAPPTQPMPTTAAGAELPVANYDELSIASLRARLRNLSSGQLAQLVEYEKGHAGRADVITMFERRIVKIADES
jgi:outer membrane biosynthesis protein TonB